MAKLMVFIDGTWLYSNLLSLADSYGKQDFQLDYGKLPKILGQKMAEPLGVIDVDIVRTYIFGSVATNYDLRDDAPVERRRAFFRRLKEEHHYETEVFDTDFRGRRIRRRDRDPNDEFEPREKCVDIALATSLLYFAAIPYAYDLAVTVIGDRDYIPVLQSVRRLGKRVAIASIRGSCAREYRDPQDPLRVKDVDMIWLNDILADIERTYDRHQLDCQSPLHRGPRKVWTTYWPKPGQPFYCDSCREEFSRQKAEAQADIVSNEVGPTGADEETTVTPGVLKGEVEKTLEREGKIYGFIRADNGRQYYFNPTDLQDLSWSDIRDGLKVRLRVVREPSGGKAGAATEITRGDTPA
jgi:hypothetical protein